MKKCKLPINIKCGTWHTSEWSQCSTTECESIGFRTRNITCKGGNICNQFKKPHINETCKHCEKHLDYDSEFYADILIIRNSPSKTKKINTTNTIINYHKKTTAGISFSNENSTLLNYFNVQIVTNPLTTTKLEKSSTMTLNKIKTEFSFQNFVQNSTHLGVSTVNYAKKLAKNESFNELRIPLPQIDMNSTIIGNFSQPNFQFSLISSVKTANQLIQLNETLKSTLTDLFNATSNLNSVSVNDHSSTVHSSKLINLALFNESAQIYQNSLIKNKTLKTIIGKTKKTSLKTTTLNQLKTTNKKKQAKPTIMTATATNTKILTTIKKNTLKRNQTRKYVRDLNELKNNFNNTNQTDNEIIADLEISFADNLEDYHYVFPNETEYYDDYLLEFDWYIGSYGQCSSQCGTNKILRGAAYKNQRN